MKKVTSLNEFQAIARAKVSRTRAANAQADPAGGGRSCADCEYMRSMRLPPPSIDKVMVCRRFPPDLSLFPMPNGVANLSGSPQVSANGWCYEFVEVSESNSEPDSKPLITA